VKHKFTLVYDLDMTMGEAVAAYLDAEHYSYLHKEYLPYYEAIRHEGRKITIRQGWHLGALSVAQTCVCEYVPPARFLNYGMKPLPWWFPSIHHIIKVRTDLRYFLNEAGDKTVSHLEVEIDMPFFLWPLRHWLERKLSTLKIKKDREDVEMVTRRQKIFGRGNLSSYLAEHQFMLHKDAFVEHFGQKKQAVEAVEAKVG
jgi:hypothetical protein